jgi:hypothetical protein
MPSIAKSNPSKSAPADCITTYTARVTFTLTFDAEAGLFEHHFDDAYEWRRPLRVARSPGRSPARSNLGLPTWAVTWSTLPLPSTRPRRRHEPVGLGRSQSPEMVCPLRADH